VIVGHHTFALDRGHDRRTQAVGQLLEFRASIGYGHPAAGQDKGPAALPQQGGCALNLSDVSSRTASGLHGNGTIVSRHPLDLGWYLQVDGPRPSPGRVVQGLGDDCGDLFGAAHTVAPGSDGSDGLVWMTQAMKPTLSWPKHFRGPITDQQYRR